ncbi:MAG: aminotransferase class I/II-fold pyridoxal phosphate-dependent enzyme [Oscillospiraceae bacterium]|nr:aminotransferase class I/II-fold pyridoxal phosphate-dependent enzyme [Oscillospiraceae bacterium]
MKEIFKSKKLDNVAYDVRGPVLDAANAMEAQGAKILKLNIGNPGAFKFEAPDCVLGAMSSTLTISEGYSDSKGILEAREAIAAYDKSKGIEGVGVDDIYTGNGVSELIAMCMQGLLDCGDEILIPSPDYPLWTGAATLAGGTAVHYVCDEQSDWMPDIEDIRRKITSKTKGIVVINPNNPTGALYAPELLEQIVSLAREHGLIIFADEIYDRLLMDGRKHISIASLAPDLFVITLNGLSKSHLIAGYRCGWMSISGDKTRAKGYIEGLNMLSSMRLCSNVPAQRAIKPALENVHATDCLLVPGGRIYDQRKAICEALDKIDGISYVKPKAAFYVFPKIDAKRFNITSDEQFVLDFLREKQVLLVHGGGFHWEAPDHFRIVFLPAPEVLRESMEKLGDFLRTYRQA